MQSYVAFFEKDLQFQILLYHVQIFPFLSPESIFRKTQITAYFFRLQDWFYGKKNYLPISRKF